MTEQASERLSGALVPTVSIVGTAAIFVLIFGTIGFSTIATFWGAWYVLIGSIPKVWGFSRFWLDVVWGAFYLPAVVLYATFLVDGGDLRILSREFITKHPWVIVTGILMAIDFVTAVFLTGGAGVIGIAVSAVTIIFFYGIWKLLWGVDFVEFFRHFRNRER